MTTLDNFVFMANNLLVDVLFAILLLIIVFVLWPLLVYMTGRMWMLGKLRSKRQMDDHHKE